MSVDRSTIVVDQSITSKEEGRIEHMDEGSAIWLSVLGIGNELNNKLSNK